MAITPALSIAQRALTAQETALAVVGHNIANVDTPGYTRQTPELTADAPHVNGQGVLIGSGVRLRRIGQVLDPLLGRRQLLAETDLRHQSVLRDELGALAETANDLGEPSLAGAVAGFFDAASALARNPAGLAERETLLGRAAALASALRGRAAGIAALQRAADARLVAAVGAANDAVGRIAELNRAIVAAEAGGQQANDLRDERQRALTTLAGTLGIATVEDAQGAVTVTATNGLTLVSGSDVLHQLAVRSGSPGLDGLVLHDVGIADAAGGFIAVPAAFTAGALAALVEVRDTHLPAAAAALDTFAGELRDQVNAVQQDPAALDLDGGSTAALPFFGGAGAADLAVALAGPNALRRIAAARSTAPGDNQNALALAGLRSTPLGGLGDATFAAYLGAEQARIGEEAAQATDGAAASALVHEQLENQRQAVSGVNLNEELTSLLSYQRAFQAVAQVISVTNQVLDDLLDII